MPAPSDESARDAPEVPERVVGGKRRAQMYAIGATMVALATVAILCYVVFTYGGALGVRAKDLVYVAFLACLIFFVVREQKRGERADRERADRRRRFRGTVRWPEGRTSRPSPDRLQRSRPHPARLATGTWHQKVLFVLILLACFGTALSILVSHASP